MAGAGPADYSGAQSEKTTSTKCNSITATPGSRRGKRTCTKPLGCRIIGRASRSRKEPLPSANVSLSLPHRGSRRPETLDFREIPRLGQLLVELMSKIAFPTLRQGLHLDSSAEPFHIALFKSIKTSNIGHADLFLRSPD